MITGVDRLLQRWAEYALARLEGLGYPTTTTLYRIMREGVIVTTGRPDYVPNLKMDSVAARVDRDIHNLPEKWQRIIYARYLIGLKDKQAAAELKMSVGSLRRHTDRVHDWLAGRWEIWPEP